MINYLLLGIGLAALVLLVRWIASGSGSDSKVIDVRMTPEKRIENLTVQELHEKAKDFLVNDGYALDAASSEGDYLAKKDGKTYLVRIDPAAQVQDPRKMNQLILNVRQSEADRGILVVTRNVSGQSRSLADKEEIRIVPPEELLNGTDD